MCAHFSLDYSEKRAQQVCRNAPTSEENDVGIPENRAPPLQDSASAWAKSPNSKVTPTTDEAKTEERSLQDEIGGLETRHRTAILAEDDDLETAASAEAGNGLDAEQRERVELRSKAKLSNFLLAAAQGRMVSGAEHELQAAAGVSSYSAIELWDVPVPAEQRSTEERAITPAPGTTGINLDPIRPAIFANSIAARLGIDMPRVASGTFATATISTRSPTSATAKAEVPGQSQRQSRRPQAR